MQQRYNNLIWYFQMKRCHLVSACLASVLAFSLMGCTPKNEDQYAASWQSAFRFKAFYETNIAPKSETRVTEVRELSIVIERSIDDVFNFFSFIPNHVQLQPQLAAFYVHNTYQNESGHEVMEFTAVENVPLGSLTVETLVHARQVVNQDEYYYETETWTAPSIALLTRDTFTDLGDGRTLITERIEFSTSKTLIGTTVEGGLSAHQTTLENLKVLMEAP
jgi:hypothetical protein